MLSGSLEQLAPSLSGLTTRQRQQLTAWQAELAAAPGWAGSLPVALLERIRREAPLLVAQAAAAEKLDWPAFLQQGRQWLAGQSGASRPRHPQTA